MSSDRGAAMLCLVVIGALATGGFGCANRQQTAVVESIPADIPGVGSAEDPMVLRRDLAATVLENYLQITLGNMEAYADSVARNREITLLGLGPDDVVVGTNPGVCGPNTVGDRNCGTAADSLPFRQQVLCNSGGSEQTPCIQVYSKDLTLRLSRDGSVGWIFDEVSYRVMRQGRQAAIPVRFTAVFVREGERWGMVMAHFSYPLPAGQINALTRDRVLVQPRSMPSVSARDRRTQMFIRVLRAWLNAGAEDRWRPTVPQERSSEPSSSALDSGLLLLWPDPYQEFHGARAYEAPSLAAALGGNTRVITRDVRISVAPNDRVAWIAATATAVSNDTSQPDSVGLRVTAVLECTQARCDDDDDDWHVMQMHVSVPIGETQLDTRIFGNGLQTGEPDEVELPVPPRL